MKSRNTTWEVIAAGCAFIALSAYLLQTPDTSPSSPDEALEIHVEVPQPPEAPSVPKTTIIDHDELENLEQELGQLEEELQELEIELKPHADITPEISTLPSFKSLPKILIYSQ